MAVMSYTFVLATCLATVQIVNSLDAGIIAYFESGCPDGWSQYTNLNGRVTIAAGYYSGTREDSVSESKTFSYGESGGEMDHTLTTSEMPSHNHNNGEYKYLLRKTGYDTSDGQDTTSDEPDVEFAEAMSNTGGSQTHNNLPPYYVLYACIKTENDDNYTLVTTFQTFKTNTNDDIYNIETSIDTINSNIDSIENNTNMLENSINNLESDIDNEIALLTKDINKLYNETDTIDTTIDVLENEIDIINEIVFRSIGNNDSIDFNAINETWTIAHDIDYIYDLISDLNDETDSLEEKDTIADKNISNLEKENEILRQNITDLIEKLDSLYEIVSQLTMTTTMDPNNEDNDNAESNSSNDSNDATITLNSFIIILSCISFVLVCCLIAMCVLLTQAYKKHSKIMTNQINLSHNTNNLTHDDKGSMINEESATANTRNNINNNNNDNTENSVKELEMENVSHGDIGKIGQMNNKVISRTATDNLSVYETANGNATALGNENDEDLFDAENDGVMNMAINKSIEDAPNVNKDNINITADNDESDSDVLFEGGPNTNDGITPAGERASIVSEGL